MALVFNHASPGSGSLALCTAPFDGENWDDPFGPYLSMSVDDELTLECSPRDVENGWICCGVHGSCGTAARTGWCPLSYVRFVYLQQPRPPATADVSSRNSGADPHPTAHRAGYLLIDGYGFEKEKKARGGKRLDHHTLLERVEELFNCELQAKFYCTSEPQSPGCDAYHSYLRRVGYEVETYPLKYMYRSVGDDGGNIEVQDGAGTWQLAPIGQYRFCVEAGVDVALAMKLWTLHFTVAAEAVFVFITADGDFHRCFQALRRLGRAIYVLPFRAVPPRYTCSRKLLKYLLQSNNSLSREIYLDECVSAPVLEGSEEVLPECTAHAAKNSEAGVFWV